MTGKHLQRGHIGAARPARRALLAAAVLALPVSAARAVPTGAAPAMPGAGSAAPAATAPAATAPAVSAPAGAQAAAALVQAELDRRIALLAELAAAPALDRPFAALRELDRLARATAERLGAAVAIADGGLAGLVDTAEEFGTPLPGLGDVPAALEALETGRPGLAEAPADAAQPLRLAVPVRRDGRLRAVLLSPVPRAALDEILAAAPAASGATLALLGPSGEILSAAEAGGLGAEPLRRAAAEGAAQILLQGVPWAVGAAALGAGPGWRVLLARPLPQAPPAARPAATPAAQPDMTAPAAQPAAMPAIAAPAAQRVAMPGIAAPPAQPAAMPAIAAQPGLPAIAAPPAQRGPAALLAAGGVMGIALLGVAGFLRGRRHAGPAPGEAAALHSLAEMRRLNDTIPVALALLDRELRFLSVNARFASITGLPAAAHIRRLPREVLPLAIAEALMAPAQGVLGTGQPAIEVPISAEAPGEIRNERHYLASCHPAQDSAGRVTGVSVVLQDVTDRVRAERARELLVRELNHRVKNTLATVQSIVASTLRQTGDTARFGATLSARLQALARAHDLLTARDWQATELGDAVQAALAPWLAERPARIIVDGTAGVTLRPGQAQALVLALHELATNAVKHGALSVPEGRVGVVWEAEAGGPVRLRWIETGGPPVTAPPQERRGFGTRLLERALASDLGSGAEVELNFAPQGLRALVRFGASAALPRIAPSARPGQRLDQRPDQRPDQRLSGPPVPLSPAA